MSTSLSPSPFFILHLRLQLPFDKCRVETEILLFTLLSKLRFEPGPEEIFWTLNFVSTPIVPSSGDLVTQQMPIRVSLVE